MLNKEFDLFIYPFISDYNQELLDSIETCWVLEINILSKEEIEIANIMWRRIRDLCLSFVLKEYGPSIFCDFRLKSDHLFLKRCY